MAHRPFVDSSSFPWGLVLLLPIAVTGCLSPLKRELSQEELLRAMASSEEDEPTSSTAKDAQADEESKDGEKSPKSRSRTFTKKASGDETSEDPAQNDDARSKSDSSSANHDRKRTLFRDPQSSPESIEEVLDALNLSREKRKEVEEIWRDVDPRERDFALRTLATTLRITAEKNNAGGERDSGHQGGNLASADRGAAPRAPARAGLDSVATERPHGPAPSHHPLQGRPSGRSQGIPPSHPSQQPQQAPRLMTNQPVASSNARDGSWQSTAPVQAVNYSQPRSPASSNTYAPGPPPMGRPATAYVGDMPYQSSWGPVGDNANGEGYRSAARIAANQRMPYSPRLPGWDPNMPVGHSKDAQRPISHGSQTQFSTAAGAVGDSFDAKDWRSALATTIMLLEDEVYNGRAVNKDRAEHLETYLHLLYAASGRSEQAVEPIYSLDEDMRQFWQHLLHSMTIEMETEAERPASLRSAAALRELRDAQRLLAKSSDLDIKQLTFCSEVQGFGQYKEFKTARFKPEQKVLLYFEVDNFVSAKTSRGYETKLKGRYAIYDANGNRVANREYPSSVEVCRNYRRDYFIRYLVTIPGHIQPGDYMLELTLEDENAKKFGQGVISFALKP